MKSIYLFLAFCLISIGAMAQKGSFTIFAEDGEKFWLVINGAKYNAKPAAKVEAKDLSGTRAKIKLIFENAKLGTYDDAVYLKDFDNKPVYATYTMRRKKDKWVMRISDYEDATRTETTTTTTPAGNTTTKTTTTGSGTSNTTTTDDGDTETVETNITMPGATVKTDMNGNINMTMTAPVETTTTVTTRTTKKTQTQKPSDIVHMKHEIPGPTGPATQTKDPVVSSPSASLKPISGTGYAALINNLKRQSFEETKLKVAKLGIKNNTFTTEQIGGILKTFNFEQSKLDVAKSAYKNCSDKDNYQNLTENFNFSSSTDELTEYIAEQ